MVDLTVTGTDGSEPGCWTWCLRAQFPIDASARCSRLIAGQTDFTFIAADERMAHQAEQTPRLMRLQLPKPFRCTSDAGSADVHPLRTAKAPSGQGLEHLSGMENRQAGDVQEDVRCMRCKNRYEIVV